MVGGDWKPGFTGLQNHIFPTRNLWLLIRANLVATDSAFYTLSTFSLTGF